MKTTPAAPKVKLAAEVAPVPAAGQDIQPTARVFAVSVDHGFKPGSRNFHRMVSLYATGRTVAELLNLKDEAGKKLTMADIRWNVRRGDLILVA